VEVLREILRVGRRAIVSFPNFGHYSVRINMLLNGQAPKTKLFPHNWYNSPNIHFLSINDFEDLCREKGFPIERRFFLAGNNHVGFLPNLIAHTAVFLLG
jgi:homoserine O-acetyltransferase